jgi:hypothetical protein
VNNAFQFFSGIDLKGLHAANPLVPLRGLGVDRDLPRSGTMLFPSFSGKRRKITKKLSIPGVVFWGQTPKGHKPWVGLAEYGSIVTCREAVQFILLFFWKENKITSTL